MGWRIQSQFPQSPNQNSDFLFHITFLFGKYHRNRSAAMHDKYENIFLDI